MSYMEKYSLEYFRAMGRKGGEKTKATKPASYYKDIRAKRGKKDINSLPTVSNDKGVDGISEGATV